MQQNARLMHEEFVENLRFEKFGTNEVRGNSEVLHEELIEELRGR